MAETPWKDQYTLLCEQCGYVLEGLETSDPCPECGKPIAESLPIDRPGTPWQQKHSIFTLLKTWYGVLRHPKRTFDEMNSIEQDGMSLLAIGLLCSISSVFFLLIVLIATFGNSERVSVLTLAFIVGIVYWIIAFVYAWISSYRIRAWTRKKYRISSDTSWAIIGHASLGLCLPPIMLFLITLFSRSLIFVSNFDHPEFTILFFSVLFSIANVAFIFSFPVGLIYFEIMCTIGIRRCKFRNQENPLSWDLSEPSQSDARTT